jgi:3-hydroxyisobutyrate dehydrogenase-like beta-hydroxyacid dehydrogenase
MVGGDEAAVERVRPVLIPIARNVYHMGHTGTAAVTKLSNNLVAGIALMGLLEGLKMGEAYGIDRDALVDVIGESAGDNFWVQHWDFFTEELGEVHPGGYDGVAEISSKDLRLAFEVASDYEVDTPALDLARRTVPDFWRRLGDDGPAGSDPD